MLLLIHVPGQAPLKMSQIFFSAENLACPGEGRGRFLVPPFVRTKGGKNCFLNKIQIIIFHFCLNC